MCVHAGQKRALAFGYQANREFLMIRKPDVNIADDFTIAVAWMTDTLDKLSCAVEWIKEKSGSLHLTLMIMTLGNSIGSCSLQMVYCGDSLQSA